MRWAGAADTDSEAIALLPRGEDGQRRGISWVSRATIVSNGARREGARGAARYSTEDIRRVLLG